MKPTQGTLIVIEGGDGSGKQTQTAKLVERLQQTGKTVFTMDFPQYGKTLGGKLVRKYLDGEFGDPKNINPIIASMFYTMDRIECLHEIRNNLENDGIVVLDRFQTANIIHQGAKFVSSEFDDPFHNSALNCFVYFSNQLEFELMNIPEPNLVLYLHVIPEVAQTLMNTQGRIKDGHESDLRYIKKVEQVALWACKTQGWKKIECCPDGQTILSPTEIHELIWQKVDAQIKFQTAERRNEDAM
ncbi:MAG: thymidylate kinase [bacterium]